MTATPILETLAREFKTSVDHVGNALEMLDAGLSSPFIGRFRRDRVGSLSESFVRRMQRRRLELEELDRRRGTILRLLEKEEGLAPAVLDRIRNCMDRFELEDLFIPHRRPEPEVQLALDRGLGALADLLVAPRPRAEGEVREEHEDHGEDHAEDHAEDHGEAAHAEAHADPAADLEHAEAELAAAAQGAAEPVSGAEEPPAPAEEAPRAAAPVEPAIEHDVLTPELARVCAPFVFPDRGIHNEGEALAGAMRILADRLGRNPRLRGTLRNMLRRNGVLSVKALVEEGKAGRHRGLLKLRQPLRQVQGHRLLGLRQAQKERILTTRITVDPRQALGKVRASLGKHTEPAFEGVLRQVAERALVHRLLPVLEEEVRLELKERADAEALRFLSQHLRQVLLAPVLGRRMNAAGLDVNAKGDWTVAIVDADGARVLADARVEVGERPLEEVGADLAGVLSAHGVRALAVGNGKASRNALPRIRAALAKAGSDTFVFLVNEAGLSSYANSDLARKELPEQSVPVRMAVSLARRLHDPLAELLKVDPRHMGLGTEQGLVSKANVKRVFEETIESCVAHAGCDLERATALVLSHLPGLDRASAERIVARRAERPFRSRAELREEGVLSEAQWTSAAAFLRLSDSTDPLDRTNLHPEQYALARRILEGVGGSEEALGRPGVTRGLRREDFDVDEETWRDLMRELSFPGRDPRPRLHPIDLLSAETDPTRLTRDRVVEGLISNVTSFGAFVDVGLPHDAMVHISETSERYVRDARETLSVGQIVRARILESGGPRLTLSLKNVPREVRERRPARGGEGGGRGPRREGGEGREGRAGREGREGRGPREQREPRVNPNLRAAQSRRDGMAGAGGGGRGGGGFRGRGGPGGGPGGGRREAAGANERVDLRSINRETGGALHNPFAAFFKRDEPAAAPAPKPAKAPKEPRPVAPESPAPQPVASEDRAES